MKAKLSEVFGRLPVERPEITFEPGPNYRRVVAAVISPSFETMDEADRQELIWGTILDELTAEEQLAIDTVFTFSPTEYAALLSGTEEPAAPTVP